jgi:hypothetical protein
LSTITPAWLLGKKVVTMAAIFGSVSECCAGPVAAFPELPGPGPFLAGPEQAPLADSRRVAARRRRKQG